MKQFKDTQQFDGRNSTACFSRKGFSIRQLSTLGTASRVEFILWVSQSSLFEDPELFQTILSHESRFQIPLARSRRTPPRQEDLGHGRQMEPLQGIDQGNRFLPTQRRLPFDLGLQRMHVNSRLPC